MVKSSSKHKTRASHPSRRPRRTTPVRRPPRDARTEQRILTAARTVFLRAGTAGARTQEIAREAGVNSALLHYYFRSKEQLAAAVFRDAAREMMTAVLGAFLSDADLETKVTNVVRLELDHLSATPGLPGYILCELSHHAERAPQFVEALTGHAPAQMGLRVRTVLGRQIDVAVRAGRLRPIAVEQFMVNLISLCVFPFAARPMLSALLGFDTAGFSAFIDRRRAELPIFFLQALRP